MTNGKPADDPMAAAKSAGLRYVNAGDPGITRQPAGKAFHYLDSGGKRVRDAATLGRIKRLAIPPAWTHVWICPRPDGHIQATGRDARGRKQYRYHEDWRSVRDETKYERMLGFGKALPRIRRQLARDLRRPGLGREKVLATMVRLLETTLVRVGNEEYARENGSIGLSTMRDRHVHVRGGTLRFKFRGKSGKHHEIELHDPRVAKIVRQTQDLPGQELFQYVDDNGEQQKITSEDVNAYLRQVAGDEYSAKDFRTWAGTVLAAVALQAFEKFETKKEAKQNVLRAIERVAERLGNTPAVCRKCYIHPIVLQSYLDGTTIDVLRGKAEEALHHALPSLSGAEGAVLAFLQQQLGREARKPPLLATLRRSVARARRQRPSRRRGTAGGAGAAATARHHKSPPSAHPRRAG